MKSVYIHIPFCNNICNYCDFPKVFKNDKMINDYLIALENEIKNYYNDEKIKTLYIGGGTPSCLNKDQFSKLKHIISLFNLEDIQEFTLECNIEDINDELLNILTKLKVTRLSIGIQSFNQKKLSYLGRKCSYRDSLNKMFLARSYGFENINLDLIYGLPDEKLKDLKKDLKSFLKLKPDHLSTYSLIVEKNTILGNKEENYQENEIEDKMYQYITKKLKNNHFEHYEISNYALKNKKSIHNLTYWKNEEYYGFGLGAHGYIEGFRYENTRSIIDYINQKYRLKENLLSKQEIMENELMLGFRLIEGINIEEFYHKFKVNIQDTFPVKPLLRNKELIYKNNHIFINPNLLYIMNEILLKLI